MLQKLWQIEEFPFHPEKLLFYETILTIGNGYLSTRASFEEGFPNNTPTTMVHGVYNHAPGKLVPELVNAPNWLPIEIVVDGTPVKMIHQNDTTSVNPTEGALLGYRRVLDMQTGTLKREVLFRASSGSIVRIVYERFASLDDVHVLAQKVTLFAVDGNPEIEVSAWIDGSVQNAGVQHWTGITPSAEGHTIALAATTEQSGYGIAVASRLKAPGQHQVSASGTQPKVTTKFTLENQTSVEVEKISSLYTTRDVEDPLTAARDKVTEATQVTYTTLETAHQAEWAKYWEHSDIQIVGDESAQNALRFVMYHILIAAPRHDDQVSIGAKTLSGYGYKGHVFWDTELFIVPPLTLTQPQLAKNLLMYRYNKLQGARNKAITNGYEGAMFPWESTDTGEETTPQWSDPQPDGSRIRIWTGDSEQHISTDIAYAILQYWNWTGDNEFLQKHGAEIVLDTAVFWGSRVEERNGRFELSQQIGPDEYHENIDNSVFTNQMVAWHLKQAVQLLGWLKTHAPEDATRLIEQLDLSPTRLAHWEDVIQRMFIPFDEEKQIHIQFPGFFDMEFIPVPLYEPRTVSVQAILGHYRSIQTQVIKQADVVMLMALLGSELNVSKDVMINNFNTYYPRTDHGSSLSPAIHAWVAAKLGMDDIAYHMFEHASQIDLKDNKGNVRDGIHGAACGGVIQAVIFGFCGLHIDDHGELQVAPNLPEHWHKVSFQVHFKGQPRRIEVTHK